MARSWRIEFGGAFYHVMSRGNERRPIFFDEEDRSSFLEILGEMAKRFEVEIFAYVLMDNHYHLLLKTRRPNLSRSMQWLGTTYTRRYNVKHHRCGHLFQGRFKNMLVQDENYIFQLSCYIHRNPLRAGIVKRLADYPWSSYPIYAYGKKTPEWLRTDVLFLRLPVTNKHKAYREMVQAYAGEEKKAWDDFHHGLFLGTQNFIDAVKSMYSLEKPDREVPQKRKVLRHSDPKAVLRKASSILQCSAEDLVVPGRLRGEDKDKRDIVIFLFWSTGFYNNKEIGDLFELSSSSISKSVSKMKPVSSKDRQMKEKIKKINSLFKV
jgi:REP element-mobilizing transposase RayT